MLPEPPPRVGDGELEVGLRKAELGSGASRVEEMGKLAHGDTDGVDRRLLAAEQPPPAGGPTDQPRSRGRRRPERSASSDDPGNPSPGLEIGQVLPAQDVASTHLSSLQSRHHSDRRVAHVQKTVTSARGEEGPPPRDLQDHSTRRGTRVTGAEHEARIDDHGGKPLYT